MIFAHHERNIHFWMSSIFGTGPYLACCNSPSFLAIGLFLFAISGKNSVYWGGTCINIMHMNTMTGVLLEDDRVNLWSMLAIDLDDSEAMVI